MSVDDLRIRKTHNALQEALFSLMQQRDFKKITVNDLCKEAQVSRAAFYAHFSNKYTFLSYCLGNISADIKAASLEGAEALNALVYDNKSLIAHLLGDMEKETEQIVFQYVLSFFDIDVDNIDKNRIKHIVLSNILAGGVISYACWHVDNRFPADCELFNQYLFDILSMLI